MKCPNCGKDVTTAFCSNCGTKIMGVCPKCGNEYIQYRKVAVESNAKSVGFLKKKTNDSDVLYQTIGACYECGYTWSVDSSNMISKEIPENVTNESELYTSEETENEKSYSKKPWWWWVLVILVFPISLSVWFWKTDVFKASRKAKVGVIAGVWIAAFISAMSSGESVENTDAIVSPVETVAEQIETTSTSDFLVNTQTSETSSIDATTPTQQETNATSNMTSQEDTAKETELTKTETTSESSAPTPEPLPAPSIDPTDAYATNTVNIREQPNTSCSVLGKVKQGEKVAVYEEEADWSHISYNGIDGYIKSEYLSENKPVAKEPVVSTPDTSSSSSGAVSNSTPNQSSSSVTSSNSNNTSSSSSTTKPVASGNTTGNYIVNRNNGKIHYSHCSKLPAEENRIYYGTIEDVKNAGYRDTCGICKPRL